MAGHMGSLPRGTLPTNFLRRCVGDGDPLEGMSTTDSVRLVESLAGEFLARACDLVRLARTQPLHDAPLNRLFNIETHSIETPTVSSEHEAVGPREACVTLDVVRLHREVLDALEHSDAAAEEPGGTLLERWTWAHEVGVEPQSRGVHESCRSQSLDVPVVYKRAVRLAACGLPLAVASRPSLTVSCAGHHAALAVLPFEGPPCATLRALPARRRLPLQNSGEQAGWSRRGLCTWVWFDSHIDVPVCAIGYPTWTPHRTSRLQHRRI